MAADSPPAANLLTANQVAARLGLSPCTVRELCAAGELRHFRFGTGKKRRAVRIDPASVDEYLAKSEQKPVQAPEAKRRRPGLKEAGFDKLRAFGWKPPAGMRVVG